MSGVGLGLDPQLEIKVRAYNMARIAGRALQALGVPEGTAESSSRGIATQTFGEIEGFQMSQGRRVAYFRISIDWEESLMTISTPGYDRTVPLKVGVRVEDQVDKQLSQLIRFFAAKTDAKKVDRVEVFCTARPGYALPDNFQPLSSDQRSALQHTRHRIGFELSPAGYEELKIAYFELE